MYDLPITLCGENLARRAGKYTYVVTRIPSKEDNLVLGVTPLLVFQPEANGKMSRNNIARKRDF